MKLKDVISEVSHNSPGKAALAFVDYVNEISPYFPNADFRELKMLGSVLIRQGFEITYKLGDSNGSPSCSFRKRDITIFLPQIGAQLHKVEAYVGNTYCVWPIADAVRKNYDEIIEVYDESEKMQARLESLIK